MHLNTNIYVGAVKASRTMVNNFRKLLESNNSKKIFILSLSHVVLLLYLSCSLSGPNPCVPFLHLP